MSHFRVLIKSLRINRLKNVYIQEKINSIKISENQLPQLTLRQKCRHCCVNLILKSRKCCLPDNSFLYHFIYKLTHTGSIENYLLKSFLGFIGGCLLSYLLFIFFVIQLRFELTNATIICAILGCILTIGLAFSSTIRCIVFLTLPQFFSKRGRQALLTYGLILTISGPLRNTLNNMEILHESLACETEQVKQVLKQILEMIKKPFYAIRDAIKSVVQKVKVIMKKIKEILLSIKRIVVSILKVIKSAFQFLGKLLNVCNKKIGTPFERCTKVFDNAIADCTAKLGPLFNWLCSITYLVKTVCWIVKIFDVICMIVDFINDSVIEIVLRKIKIFIRHIRTMFYVRIKFSHSFQMQSYSSKSMSDIKNSIINEIKERTNRIVVIFGYMNCVTSLFFFYIILRVLYYRYRFLTSTRFDNNYITKDFVEIDLRRAQLERETVLPLKNRERSKYVTIRSVRLATWERQELLQSVIKLTTAATRLGCYILLDYVVYWIASKIRYFGSYGTKIQAPMSVTLKVEGKAIFADLLRSIVNAFRPNLPMEVETVACLPNPLPPDYDRYIEIAILLFFCTILAVFEPYGLRLRQWVMCYYYPNRSRQRAIWLYNQIIKSRTSFLKIARRKLRRMVKGNERQPTVTFKEYLKYKLSWKCCRFLFNFQPEEACLLCGQTFSSNDTRIKLIHCITPGCLGVYCQQCFDDLKNVCTICKSPVEYGDFSDLSEEIDSSEDEEDHERFLNDVKKNEFQIISDPDLPKSKDSFWGVHDETLKSDEEENKLQVISDPDFLKSNAPFWGVSKKTLKNEGEEEENIEMVSLKGEDEEDLESLQSLYELGPEECSPEESLSDYYPQEATTTGKELLQKLFEREISQRLTESGSKRQSLLEPKELSEDSSIYPQPSTSTNDSSQNENETKATNVEFESILDQNLPKRKKRVSFWGVRTSEEENLEMMSYKRGKKEARNTSYKLEPEELGEESLTDDYIQQASTSSSGQNMPQRFSKEKTSQKLPENRLGRQIFRDSNQQTVPFGYYQSSSSYDQSVTDESETESSCRCKRKTFDKHHK